jgi:hypothetical protein
VKFEKVAFQVVVGDWLAVRVHASEELKKGSFAYVVHDPHATFVRTPPIEVRIGSNHAPTSGPVAVPDAVMVKTYSVS